ncbi:hypothetical protein NUW58_g7470 [Xylaria curta]|uniref:Uncharacterized protein n=1 Tax=Xylaria curta TaxID=42375 RepID=A0ACC1NIR8_9PEZI|nr:hypothetical protein NUW58_g7470 [Xylaria curta]
MDFTELLGTPETEPCVDIVTVHGLTRAGKQPWQDTDKRPKWLELKLFETSNVRVIIFNYEESGSGGFPVYTKRGIEMTAQMLLERVASWRKSDVECHRPLAFVSHDFGGTIVKQAMVFASMNPENRDFPVRFQHFDTLLQLWNEDSSTPKAVMFTYDPLDSRGIVGSISDKDTGIPIVLATLLVQAIAYILPGPNPWTGQSMCLNPSDVRKGSNIALLSFGFLSTSTSGSSIGDDQPTRIVQVLTECFDFSEFKPAILFIDPDQQLADIMEQADIPRFEHTSLDRQISDITNSSAVPRIQSLCWAQSGLQRMFDKVESQTGSHLILNVLERGGLHPLLTTPSANNATALNLTVLIRSGLYETRDVLSLFDQGELASDSGLVLIASLEALRREDTGLIKALPLSKLDGQQLKKALTLAVKCHAGSDAMAFLFSEAKDHLPLSHEFLSRLWPEGVDRRAVILRACRIELTDVLSRYSDNGISSNNAVLAAMQEACRTGIPSQELSSVWQILMSDMKICCLLPVPTAITEWFELYLGSLMVKTSTTSLIYYSASH